MAWRNQGITGSNNIPLGNRRRFGGSDSSPPVDDGGYNPTQPSTGLSDSSYKRGRSPEPKGKLQSVYSLDAMTLTSVQQSLLTVVSVDARSETAGVMPQKIRPLVLWA